MGQSKSKPKSFYWEFVNSSAQDIINSKCYYGTEKNHTARIPNLEGLRISSNASTVREEAGLQLFLGCPFYMTLSFSDGSTDEFRVSLPSKESVDFAFLEGRHHVTCCRSSKSKVTITVENNKKQQDDDSAREKNREGEDAVQQNRYEDALKMFNEALKLAKEDSTIKSIEKNKICACVEFGKECLQKAWDLEKSDDQNMSPEAQDLFVKAKLLFEDAQTVGKSSYQQDLQIINLKIEGNRVFNEACDLEREVSRLESDGNSDNINVKSMYSEVISKYEEAVKKFEEGLEIDSKFDHGLKIANGRVQYVKKKIGGNDNNIML